MEWSDEVPHLQPWFGTGVYANAFGCEYLWRKGEAPDTHVRYARIEEVRGLEMPDWRKGPVMRMVLDEIDILKERTRGRFPIALTDTQSPCDTATLVLDTSELFTACYTEEETAASLMQAAADLIIEFSRVQAERIGEGLVSRPGHVMPSLPSLRGITVSDDNMAVSSPQVNERFSLRFDAMIARALGGVVLHSCGVWDHTMEKLRSPEVIGVDCSVARAWDPTPMTPEAVGDALEGTGVAVKARCGGTPQEIRAAVRGLARPGMRIILDIARIDEDEGAYRAAAESNYRLAREELTRAFGR
jgi:uroporphyrinogen-III decarboxylase